MHLFFSLHVHVILILTHLFYIKMAYFYLQINEKNGHEQKKYCSCYEYLDSNGQSLSNLKSIVDYFLSTKDIISRFL